MGQTISLRREERRVHAQPCDVIEREFVNDCIFTDETGKILSAWQAIHRNNFASVFYRGVRMTSLFSTMKCISENGYAEDFEGVEVFCGYSPYKDAFYYLHYIQDDQYIKHEDCMVCLDPLSEHVAVRVISPRCVHNLHHHCYKNLVEKNLSVAGCCRGCYGKIQFYMKIIGYTEHRFVIAGSKLREYRCSIEKLE